MELTSSNLSSQIRELNSECQRVYENSNITIGQLLGDIEDVWLTKLIADVIEGKQFLLDLQKEYTSTVRP